jgi:Lon protease-like protein
MDGFNITGSIDFSGRVRLFPLPNLVLFPHVVQGLHIFEPRYRQMMADTLDDDMLMATVLLQDGWESNYDGRPPIEEIACLGRVGPHEKLADGRYNLRLQGLSRIRILRELKIEKPYRIAEAELVADIVPDDLTVLKQLRTKIADAVLPRFPADSTAHQQIDELIHGDTPLGPLCDMLSYALPLPQELKQQLLATPDVSVRAEVLADALFVKTAVRERKFPPDFSNN